VKSAAIAASLFPESAAVIARAYATPQPHYEGAGYIYEVVHHRGRQPGHLYYFPDTFYISASPSNDDVSLPFGGGQRIRISYHRAPFLAMENAPMTESSVSFRIACIDRAHVSAIVNKNSAITNHDVVI